MMAKAASSVDNSQKKAVDLLHRIKGSPRTDSMPHLWPMTMLKTAFLTIVVMLVALLAGCAESGEEETEEASIIDKVVNEITINGISLSKTNHKIFDVIGGSRPYPWDLWKPRGICRYYLVEDLSTPLEDNYRDAIIGISLIFPCDEADRDYEKCQILVPLPIWQGCSTMLLSWMKKSNF